MQRDSVRKNDCKAQAKKIVTSSFLCHFKKTLKKRKKRRMVWDREIYQQREEKGAYTQILQALHLSDTRLFQIAKTAKLSV